MEIKLEQLLKLISKYSENVYYPVAGLAVTALPIIMLCPSVVTNENNCGPMIYLWIVLFLFALFSEGCLIIITIKWSNRKIHNQINAYKKKKEIQKYYTELFSPQIWNIVCRLINNKNTPEKLSKSLYEEFDNRNLFGEDRPLQKDKQPAYLFGTQEMMMVTMKKQKKKYTSKNVLGHNLFLEADIFL